MCERVKVACVVHQGLLPTSREGGCNSEAEPSLARRAEELEGSGAGAGTVGDKQTTSAAVDVSPHAQTPWTRTQDLFIKTSTQLPGDSLLLVGECLFLQLLPHLLPLFLFSIIAGLELGPALRFPYYKALSPLVLEKNPRNN